MSTEREAVNLVPAHNEIVVFPDPVLLRVAKPVTDLTEWKTLVPQMFRLMAQSNGCGLAAPQIGHSARLFVMRWDDADIVVVNPEVLDAGGRDVTMIEGCLSLPRKQFAVVRPEWVRAKWTDLDGVTTTLTLAGIMSRIFQHEFDHLNGRLISFYPQVD